MIGSSLRGRYEIAGLLADGPIFSAYSARDRNSGRDVCIRVINQPFSAATDFVRALASSVTQYGAVRNPHLEQIYDVEADESKSFLVGDLTRGPSLADRIRKLAPFSIPVSVGTAISTCQALEPMHRNGLPHGGLTPGNMAVLADGEVRLQLAGLWQALAVNPSAAALELPMQAPYLAPEVSAGAPPSPGSDIYALGIILYELLSGRLPYYGETLIALALQHATTPTPWVRDVNPSVPVVLNEIIGKAMSKRPEERYASAGEMVADLRLMQDALRFGRPLSWPLRQAPVRQTNSAVQQRVQQREPAGTQPVAPRMSALRSDDQYQASGRRQKPERDVPLWMSLGIAILCGVVISLVGVWALMSFNRPRIVRVPKIVGMSATEATSLLRERKLELRNSGTRPSESVQTGNIIEVLPEPGAQVREGSSVAVVTSSGSQFVSVPDLRGTTRDKARTVLNSLGLEIDPQILKQPDAQIGEDLVIKTAPSDKTRVDRGSVVQLIVSSGPSPTNATDVPVDNSTGGDQSGSQTGAQAGGANTYLYTLSITLKDLQQPTQVRVDMTDDDGTKSVYDQERNTGDKIEISSIGRGHSATFYIYYDNILKKTITKPAQGEASQQ